MIKKSAILGAAGLFISAISPFTLATETSLNTVKVLVAYTDKAREWTDPEDGDTFSCNRLLLAANNDIAEVKEITGINHVCQEDSQLGHSADGMDNLIDVIFAEINQVYRHSGVSNVQFVPVGSYRVANENGAYVEGPADELYDHNETGFSALASGQALPGELFRLRNQLDADTPNHKILNSVHAKRLDVKADIVVMLTDGTIDDIVFRDKDGVETKRVDGTNGLAGGIGVLSAKNAFAALTVNTAAAPGYVFSHEISHLLGANHYYLSSIVPIPGLDFLFGKQDIIAAEPDFISGNRIDAWAFSKRKTLNENGDEVDLATPYTTLLSNDGNCSNCTRLPLLSTLNPSANVLPNDYGSETRNNARVVANAIERIAAFGDSLESPAVENNNKVGIDFGYDMVNGIIANPLDIKPIDYKTAESENWNNITQRQRTSIKTPLIDQQGNLTPYEFNITRSFHGQTKVGNIIAIAQSFGIDEMPTMAMTDGLTAVRLFTSPRFEISGLDANKTYSFKLFGSNKVVESKRVTEFVVKGVDELGNTQYHKNKISTHANIYRFAEFIGIKPSSDGVIEIKVVADMFTVPFFTAVSLNAMEFYQD